MSGIAVHGSGFVRAMTLAATPQAFREARAGLLVFGVLRDALVFGNRDPDTATAALCECAHLDQGDLRNLLIQIVWEADRPQPKALATRCIALAKRWYHDRGFYRMAADLLSTVVDSPHVECETRRIALWRRACAYRSSHSPRDIDRAEMEYNRLEREALRAGDTTMAFRARVGLGAIAVQRARFSEARLILADVAVRAERARDFSVASDAYINLSAAVAAGHDYRATIRFAAKALLYADTPSGTHRAMQNIGMAYERLGERDIAARILAWIEAQPINRMEQWEAEHLRHELAEPEPSPLEPATVVDLIDLNPLLDAVRAAAGQ